MLSFLVSALVVLSTTANSDYKCQKKECPIQKTIYGQDIFSSSNSHLDYCPGQRGCSCCSVQQDQGFHRKIDESVAIFEHRQVWNMLFNSNFINVKCVDFLHQLQCGVNCDGSQNDFTNVKYDSETGEVVATITICPTDCFSLYKACEDAFVHGETTRRVGLLFEDDRGEEFAAQRFCQSDFGMPDIGEVVVQLKVAESDPDEDSTGAKCLKFIQRDEDGELVEDSPLPQPSSGKVFSNSLNITNPVNRKEMIDINAQDDDFLSEAVILTNNNPASLSPPNEDGFDDNYQMYSSKKQFFSVNPWSQVTGWRKGMKGILHLDRNGLPNTKSAEFPLVSVQSSKQLVNIMQDFMQSPPEIQKVGDGVVLIEENEDGSHGLTFFDTASVLLNLWEVSTKYSLEEPCLVKDTQSVCLVKTPESSKNTLNIIKQRLQHYARPVVPDEENEDDGTVNAVDGDDADADALINEFDFDFALTAMANQTLASSAASSGDSNLTSTVKLELSLGLLGPNGLPFSNLTTVINILKEAMNINGKSQTLPSSSSPSSVDSSDSELLVAANGAQIYFSGPDGRMLPLDKQKQLRAPDAPHHPIVLVPGLNAPLMNEPGTEYILRIGPGTFQTDLTQRQVAANPQNPSMPLLSPVNNIDLVYVSSQDGHSWETIDEKKIFTNWHGVPLWHPRDGYPLLATDNDRAQTVNGEEVYVTVAGTYLALPDNSVAVVSPTNSRDILSETNHAKLLLHPVQGKPYIGFDDQPVSLGPDNQPEPPVFGPNQELLTVSNGYLVGPNLVPVLTDSFGRCAAGPDGKLLYEGESIGDDGAGDEQNLSHYKNETYLDTPKSMKTNSDGDLIGNDNKEGSEGLEEAKNQDGNSDSDFSGNVDESLRADGIDQSSDVSGEDEAKLLDQGGNKIVGPDGTPVASTDTDNTDENSSDGASNNDQDVNGNEASKTQDKFVSKVVKTKETTSKEIRPSNQQTTNSSFDASKYDDSIFDFTAMTVGTSGDVAADSEMKNLDDARTISKNAKVDVMQAELSKQPDANNTSTSDDSSTESSSSSSSSSSASSSSPELALSVSAAVGTDNLLSDSTSSSSSTSESSESSIKCGFCVDDPCCWPVWSISITALYASVGLTAWLLSSTAQLYPQGFLSKDFMKKGGSTLMKNLLAGFVFGCSLGGGLTLSLAGCFWGGGFGVCIVGAINIAGWRGAVAGGVAGSLLGVMIAYVIGLKTVQVWMLCVSACAGLVALWGFLPVGKQHFDFNKRILSLSGNSKKKQNV